MIKITVFFIILYSSFQKQIHYSLYEEDIINISIHDLAYQQAMVDQLSIYKSGKLIKKNVHKKIIDRPFSKQKKVYDYLLLPPEIRNQEYNEDKIDFFDYISPSLFQYEEIQKEQDDLSYIDESLKDYQIKSIDSYVNIKSISILMITFQTKQNEENKENQDEDQEILKNQIVIINWKTRENKNKDLKLMATYVYLPINNNNLQCGSIRAMGNYIHIPCIDLSNGDFYVCSSNYSKKSAFICKLFEMNNSQLTNFNKLNIQLDIYEDKKGNYIFLLFLRNSTEAYYRNKFLLIKQHVYNLIEIPIENFTIDKIKIHSYLEQDSIVSIFVGNVTQLDQELYHFKIQDAFLDSFFIENGLIKTNIQSWVYTQNSLVLFQENSANFILTITEINLNDRIERYFNIPRVAKILKMNYQKNYLIIQVKRDTSDLYFYSIDLYNRQVVSLETLKILRTLTKDGYSNQMTVLHEKLSWFLINFDQITSLIIIEPQKFHFKFFSYRLYMNGYLQLHNMNINNGVVHIHINDQLALDININFKSQHDNIPAIVTNQNHIVKSLQLFQIMPITILGHDINIKTHHDQKLFFVEFIEINEKKVLRHCLNIKHYLYDSQIILFCENEKMLIFNYYHDVRKNKIIALDHQEYKITNFEYDFTEIFQAKIFLNKYLLLINKDKNRIFYGEIQIDNPTIEMKEYKFSYLNQINCNKFCKFNEKSGEIICKSNHTQLNEQNFRVYVQDQCDFYCKVSGKNDEITCQNEYCIFEVITVKEGDNYKKKYRCKQRCQFNTQGISCRYKNTIFFYTVQFNSEDFDLLYFKEISLENVDPMFFDQVYNGYTNKESIFSIQLNRITSNRYYQQCNNSYCTPIIPQGILPNIEMANEQFFLINDNHLLRIVYTENMIQTQSVFQSCLLNYKLIILQDYYDTIYSYSLNFFIIVTTKNHYQTYYIFQADFQMEKRFYTTKYTEKKCVDPVYKNSLYQNFWIILIKCQNEIKFRVLRINIWGPQFTVEKTQQKLIFDVNQKKNEIQLIEMEVKQSIKLESNILYLIQNKNQIVKKNLEPKILNIQGPVYSLSSDYEGFEKIIQDRKVFISEDIILKKKLKYIYQDELKIYSFKGSSYTAIYQQFLFLDNKINYQNMYIDCIKIVSRYDEDTSNKIYENMFICRSLKDYHYYMSNFDDINISLEQTVFSSEIKIEKAFMISVSGQIYLFFNTDLHKKFIQVLKFQLINKNEMKIFFRRQIDVFKKIQGDNVISDYDLVYLNDHNTVSIFFHIQNTPKFIVQNFNLYEGLIRFQDIFNLYLFDIYAINILSLKFRNSGYKMKCIGASANRVFYIVFTFKQNKWNINTEKQWINPYGNNSRRNKIIYSKKYIGILFEQTPQLSNIMIFEKQENNKNPFTLIGNSSFKRDDYYINDIAFSQDKQTKDQLLHIFYQSEQDGDYFTYFGLKTLRIQKITGEFEIEKLKAVSKIKLRFYISPFEFNDIYLEVHVKSKQNILYLQIVLTFIGIVFTILLIFYGISLASLKNMKKNLEIWKAKRLREKEEMSSIHSEISDGNGSQVISQNLSSQNNEVISREDQLIFQKIYLEKQNQKKYLNNNIDERKIQNPKSKQLFRQETFLQQ